MAGRLERYLLLTQLPSSLGPTPSPCSRSFSYRPQRPTFQRALGKDVQWEIIGYGTALPASASLRSPQSRPDWFVAYAHPLPLLHPFISVYFRPEVVRQKPGIVTLLLEDILDALRHATDPWVEEQQEDEGEEVAGGSVGPLAGSSTSEEPEGSHAANAAAAGNVANGAPVQSSSTGRSDHHIPTVQDLQRDGGRGRTRNRTVAPTDAYDSNAHSVGYSAGHGPASTPLIPGATATPSGHGGFGHGQVLNRSVRTSNGDESEGGGSAIQPKTWAAGTTNGHAQSNNGGEGGGGEGGPPPPAATATTTAPSISSTTSSKATKAEKKREDLKWAVMHLSSEVRPIRGHLSSSRSPR